MSELTNWEYVDEVSKDKRIAWPTDVMEEMKAHVAEAKRVMEKGYSNEQTNAHMELYMADYRRSTLLLKEAQ